MPKERRVPKYFRITSRGRWFILITLAVGGAALNTGHNLIYLCLALNLSLLITSGMLSDLATRRVSLELDRDSIHHAGPEGSLLFFSLYNGKKLLPLFFVKVFFHIEGTAFEGECPFVPPGDSRKAFVRVYFRRRGIRSLRKITIMTSFPFGFFEKYYHVRCDLRIPVAPEKGSLFKTAEREAEEFEKTRDIPATSPFADGHSMRDVRNYLPSDPMKLIMWKKYAERGNLYVRVLEDEFPHAEKIFVGPDPDRDAFEERLRNVTGQVCDLHSRGIPFELVFEDGSLFCPPDKNAIKKALLFLAVVGCDALMGPWEKTVEEAEL